MGLTASQLEALRQWLREEGCTHVVMESTGCYWELAFNILEDSFTIGLAGRSSAAAATRRGTPPGLMLRGRSVTPCDAASSFIPPRPLRELRGLHVPAQATGAQAVQEQNGVLKTLEKGNIKLGYIFS